MSIPTGRNELAVDGVGQHCGQRLGGVCEVIDGLEERHDVELSAGWTGARGRFRCRFDEADFLQKYGHFEHIADRLGHRDHIVRDGALADTCDRAGSFVEYVEFADGLLVVFRVRVAQQARRTEFSGEQLDALGLVECEVVGVDVGVCQEVSNHDFVDCGVLAHVEAAEVGAEDGNGAAGWLDHGVG